MPRVDNYCIYFTGTIKEGLESKEAISLLAKTLNEDPTLISDAIIVISGHILVPLLPVEVY